MKNQTLSLFAFFFLVINLSFYAQIKPTLSIQGVVRSDDGGAVQDGKYLFTFNIYSSSSGGNALWTEKHENLAVNNGVYGAELGSVKPLNLAFDSTYWVGVTFNNGSEMTPLIKLSSAPYALSLIGTDNIFPNAGNVGIGTTTPSEQLVVDGNMNVTEEATIGRVKLNGGHLTYNSENAVINWGTGHIGKLHFRGLESTGDHGTYEGINLAILDAETKELTVNGNIKFADSLNAVGTLSEKQTKIIFGFVDATGNSSGVGYKSVKGLTGSSNPQYTITYNSPFSGTPIVTVTGFYHGTGAAATYNNSITLVSSDSNGFTVRCVDHNAQYGDRTDATPFNFIAIGER